MACRQRLDRQWAYLHNLVHHLNYFANALIFDGQEMELLRELLDQLTKFDPRKTAAQKREKTLGMLGSGSGQSAPLNEGDVLVEAAAMGAYALAQTAIQDTERRTQLEAAFDVLINDQSAVSEDYKKTLIQSREKVDKLYDATRAQILAASKKPKK